ncbi:hypothetical protein HXA35_15590 [Bacillus sp. A301a_S52]|nr:hypothetical protein [Bacillus sp. A301a_S52]
MFQILVILLGSSALFHFIFPNATWPDYYTLGGFIIALLMYIVSRNKKENKN